MKFRAKELLFLTAPILLLVGAVVYQKQKPKTEDALDGPLRMVLVYSKLQQVSDDQKAAGCDRNIKLRFALKGTPDNVPANWIYKTNSNGIGNIITYLPISTNYRVVTKKDGWWNPMPKRLNNSDNAMMGNWGTSISTQSGNGELDMTVLAVTKQISKNKEGFQVFDIECVPTTSSFPRLKMGRFFLNLNTGKVHRE